MQLSAVLVQPHFPHPPPPAHPPPPPVKNMSPSQLHRQEGRQREAEAKAGEAVPNINIISEDNLVKDVSTSKETEIIEEVVLGETAVKLAKNTADESLPILSATKCNPVNGDCNTVRYHILGYFIAIFTFAP